MNDQQYDTIGHVLREIYGNIFPDFLGFSVTFVLTVSGNNYLDIFVHILNVINHLLAYLLIFCQLEFC